jgi:hypothetical protein
MDIDDGDENQHPDAEEEHYAHGHWDIHPTIDGKLAFSLAQWKKVLTQLLQGNRVINMVIT